MLRSVSWMEQVAAGRPWVIHQARPPQQWGVHHSKAFLVHFDGGLRVIVHTANLIYQDCNCKTQGLWYQDFPKCVLATLYPLMLANMSSIFLDAGY